MYGPMIDNEALSVKQTSLVHVFKRMLTSGSVRLPIKKNINRL